LEDAGVVGPREHREDLPALRKDISRIGAGDGLAMNQLAVDEALVIMAVPATGGAMYPGRVGIGGALFSRTRLDAGRPLHQRMQARLEFAAHFIEGCRRHPAMIDATVLGEHRQCRRRSRIRQRGIDLSQARIEVVGKSRLVKTVGEQIGVDARLEPCGSHREIGEKMHRGTATLLQFEIHVRSLLPCTSTQTRFTRTAAP
ncbi:MAG: hypothetical protein ACK55I_04640, partial [bacterium]